MPPCLVGIGVSQVVPTVRDLAAPLFAEAPTGAQRVKKMLGPPGSQRAGAGHVMGVPQPTLSQWKRGAVERAAMVPPTEETRVSPHFA